MSLESARGACRRPLARRNVRNTEYGGTEGLAHTPVSWECYFGRSGQGTEGNYQGWGRMDGAEVPRSSLVTGAQNHLLSRSPGLAEGQSPLPLHYARPHLVSASTTHRQPHPPALELKAALKLGGWGSEGDKTPGFSWFTGTAAAKLPGTLPVFTVENHPRYKKTSGAPYWQLCVIL